MAVVVLCGIVDWRTLLRKRGRLSPKLVYRGSMWRGDRCQSRRARNLQCGKGGSASSRKRLVSRDDRRRASNEQRTHLPTIPLSRSCVHHCGLCTAPRRSIIAEPFGEAAHLVWTTIALRILSWHFVVASDDHVY